MPSVLSLRLQTIRPDLDLSQIQFFRHQTYLLTGVSAAGDDGDSADLEELHFDVVCRRINMKLEGLVNLALRSRLLLSRGKKFNCSGR